MRLFWTGTLTAVLAIAGAPIAVQALSLPNHVIPQNPQLVQAQHRGGEQPGSGDKGDGDGRATLNNRRESGPRVKSGEDPKSPALRRADRDDRGRIDRNRSPRAEGGRNGDRHRGVRYSWGPGAEFFFYDGYYHGDCSWLRRKANATDSSYWWRRYRQCRELD